MNRYALYTNAIAGLFFFTAGPSFAEDIVAGVSSDPQTQSLPGDIEFENPCLFIQTLPLVIEENPDTNLFVLDNGAILHECSNFGVTGQSSPNFLAYNCNATNSDGTTPALPALFYFPQTVPHFQAKVGDGVDVGSPVTMYGYDAAFNLIDSDSSTVTSALQTMSVTGNNMQIVVIDGPCRLVVDDLQTTDPSCALDTDQDRLPDCAETNTGIYISPDDTGTDPNNPDTDGDALGDGDEVLGTVNNLDLPGLGVSPLRKDILIEYDWFDDSLECGSHSHRPTQATLNMVATAFANAPVSNPDGTTGINFIQDRGQGGLLSGGNLIADADGVLTGGVNSAEFMNHKAANFAANREGYFHYTILPHRYNTNSGSSGQAELPGDDLIVSLYCANSNQNVANTIMHELGHNLILRHGGFENCNWKPNYNSVMNYKYQFPGIDNDCTPPGNGVLDFSVGDRIVLNENNLNEFNGTCGPGNPWDWDGDGVLESSVIFDVNPPNSSCGGTHTILRDYDDWANLLFTGLLDADGALPVTKEVIDCTNAPHVLAHQAHVYDAARLLQKVKH